MNIKQDEEISGNRVYILWSTIMITRCLKAKCDQDCEFWYVYVAAVQVRNYWVGDFVSSCIHAYTSHS